MPSQSISKITFRRFLLGQQGLWPGRRFGAHQSASALDQMCALQLDPLNMVARSQDIAMYGRVLDYKPEHLYQMAYRERQAFDYGGTLFMYPMRELPYWRVTMNRVHAHPRVRQFKKRFPNAIKQVQDTLRDYGALSNRDFQGERLKYWSYRGRKDTSVALYYSWLVGDVMITQRKGFDRIYDLRERVAPKEFDHEVAEKESEDFFARKVIAFHGIMREKRWKSGWADYIEREVTPKEEKQKLAQLQAEGVAVVLQVEDSKENWLTLAENVPLLEELEAGRIPKAWTPLDTTTHEEVTFLAPLEIVSARGRAKQVFDFEYIWEVYKPAQQRRWGYYTLPILYGDDLVARLDPKLDRKTNTLHILGFWLEDDAPHDEDFACALAKGIRRFADMTGAAKIDLSGIKTKKLKQALKEKLKT